VIHDCECGRPIHDTAVICRTCGEDVRTELGHVAAYHGLAYDLQLAMARQSRLGARDGSRPTEAAVPFDSRASGVADKLKNTLVGWARIVADETGADLPADDLARIAGWLGPRIGWLRYHEDGAEAYGDVTRGVREVRRIIDRPPDKSYVGPCDCGADLYAKIDARFAHCPGLGCGKVWPVDERRLWLLESARDVLASGMEISRALTRYAQPVTPSALRGYVHRGQLISRGERVEGSRMVMLYRLGDVLDILARQAERVSA
jgi:hypothetical protein